MLEPVLNSCYFELVFNDDLVLLEHSESIVVDSALIPERGYTLVVLAMQHGRSIDLWQSMWEILFHRAALLLFGLWLLLQLFLVLCILYPLDLLDQLFVFLCRSF